MINAHPDLAWNALQLNRDLLQAVYPIRSTEASTPSKARAQHNVALPELRQGRIALCFGTLLTRSTGKTVPHIDFASPLQAHAIAQGQVVYYHALVHEGHARIITNTRDLDAHIAEWLTWDDTRNNAQASAPPLGLIICMESADPILTPEHLESWWDAGVRIIGPAHQRGDRYAGGTGVETDLSQQGYALLEEMQQAGMILDLTHLTDEGSWQTLDHYQRPVIASHNNSRTLVPHQRQLSDTQIKAVTERDGVIGLALDTWMLQTGWIKGVSSNEGITLHTVADHIDHICNLTGNGLHVVMGSDLDGGFGREQSLSGLDTLADLQGLIPILQERDYTQDAIAAVMHCNWLRLLRKTWGTSK